MIETERLMIKPLTYEDLKLYIQNNGSLEKAFQLERSNEIISPELWQALEESILPAVADISNDYLFYTLWTGILKSENRMIGDCCFKGKPNAEGSIEIGYGTYEQYRGKGMMTEMVSGMIEWARTQKDIKHITAETDKTNPASAKVLLKNNFIITHQTETQNYWQVNIRDALHSL